MNDIPTPRTDAVTLDGQYRERGSTITLQSWEYFPDKDGYGEVVKSDFARQLERELAELSQRLIDRTAAYETKAVADREEILRLRADKEALNKQLKEWEEQTDKSQS